MQKYLWTIGIIVVATSLPNLSGHGGEQEDVSKLRRKKLEAAQKVLEGIALNDFDKIAQQGEELILISKAAEWRVLKSPQYEVHSNTFRRVAEDLIEKAQATNLDGATLAYVDLTMTCVKCHKHVREVRKTGLDGLRPSWASRSQSAFASE